MTQRPCWPIDRNAAHQTDTQVGAVASFACGTWTTFTAGFMSYSSSSTSSSSNNNNNNSNNASICFCRDTNRQIRLNLIILTVHTNDTIRNTRLERSWQRSRFCCVPRLVLDVRTLLSFYFRRPPLSDWVVLCPPFLMSSPPPHGRQTQNGRHRHTGQPIRSVSPFLRNWNDNARIKTPMNNIYIYGE